MVKTDTIYVVLSLSRSFLECERIDRCCGLWAVEMDCAQTITVVVVVVVSLEEVKVGQATPFTAGEMLRMRDSSAGMMAFLAKARIGPDKQQRATCECGFDFAKRALGPCFFQRQTSISQNLSPCQLCFFSHRNATLDPSGLGRYTPCDLRRCVAGLMEPPSFATAHILVSPEP